MYKTSQIDTIQIKVRGTVIKIIYDNGKYELIYADVQQIFQVMVTGKKQQNLLRDFKKSGSMIT